MELGKTNRALVLELNWGFADIRDGMMNSDGGVRRDLVGFSIWEWGLQVGSDM